MATPVKNSNIRSSTVEQTACGSKWNDRDAIELHLLPALGEARWLTLCAASCWAAFPPPPPSPARFGSSRTCHFQHHHKHARLDQEHRICGIALTKQHLSSRQGNSLQGFHPDALIRFIWRKRHERSRWKLCGRIHTCCFPRQCVCATHDANNATLTRANTATPSAPCRPPPAPAFE